MWLQLTAACVLAALTLSAPVAFAQPLAQVDSRAGVYQDTDRTTVATTNLTARGETSHLSIETRYLVDVISSASIDVVSAATGRIHDVRNEVEWGLGYRDDWRRAKVSVIRSVEHDWWSIAGEAGFAQDLAHHDLTLELEGSYVANDVGRAGDPNFLRHMTVADASAGLTMVATPRDIFDFTYSLSYVDGYQASPYRFVTFDVPGAPLPIAAPETDPDTRIRHALTVRYNRALFQSIALRSHARAYVDSWGVASATVGTDGVLGAGDVELAVFVRGYAQQHAAFYQPEYAQPMRYMTADRELSTFVDAFAGGRATWSHEKPWSWVADVRAEARVSGFYFWFFDFPRLPQRGGILAELAAGITF